MPAAGGIFDDPGCFRFLVALLCACAGFAVFSLTAKVVRTGVLWAIVVVVLAVDPFGLYLFALAGALVAPRSRLANWYRTARRHAWTLIAVWAVLILVALLTHLGMGW